MTAVRAQSDRLFESSLDSWLALQIKSSQGERKRKLTGGLGYAEKLFITNVLWPAMRTLEHLHAEYEVRDFKDGVRFLDFAYVIRGLRICIEIDAFSTHYRDLDRRQFADHLTRQNHLIIDGWKVLRFSLDDIKENPRSCQQLLLHALGKWGLETKQEIQAGNPIDLAILKYLRTLDAAASPTQVAHELGWHRITMSIHMRGLLDQGYLIAAASGKKRIKSYRLNPAHGKLTGSKTAANPKLPK